MLALKISPLACLATVVDAMLFGKLSLWWGVQDEYE